MPYKRLLRVNFILFFFFFSLAPRVWARVRLQSLCHSEAVGSWSDAIKGAVFVLRLLVARTRSPALGICGQRGGYDITFSCWQRSEEAVYAEFSKDSVQDSLLG